RGQFVISRLFPNKDTTRFRMQLINWTNKAYLFDFDRNWNNYLVENPVYFWNNLQNEVPELAIFAA
ncbi:16890_t:CDS:1, partial [Cetraspora pellucida]